MDGQSPPTSSKRGRKAKVKPPSEPSKNSNSFLPTVSIASSVGSSTPTDSITCVSTIGNGRIDTGLTMSVAGSSCSSRSDNLLMPPPAQPENSSKTEMMEREGEGDGPADHEFLIDGFSIVCFTTQDEVQVRDNVCSG